MYPPTTPVRTMLNTAAVLFVLGLAWLLIQVRSIILVLILGIVLAAAIEPIVYRLRRKGLTRGQAIMTVYVGLIALFSLGIYLIFPPLVRQGGALFDSIPGILDDLETQARQSDNEFIRSSVRNTLDNIGDAFREFRLNPPIEGTTALGFFTSLVGLLFTTITVLIVAFYWMTEKAIIKRVILGLFPLDRRDRAHALWDTIEAKIGGWTRGQLVLCAVIGSISAVAYSPLLLDVKFWLALAIWAGVTELIPFIGPFLGGGAAAVVALASSPEKALMVVVFVIVLQQLEGAFLVPRVMRNAVGLTPLTVVLAVLVGGVLAGPIGSVLAIPVAAAVQVLLQNILYGTHEDPLARDHGTTFAASVIGEAEPPSSATDRPDPSPTVPPSAPHGADSAPAAG
ncbi:MAG TPA: AI-2E family transporter [Thermomicrobiales bacterium]|nr:AI-2E family transporter [Thermomicrobiales bacterium]